MAETLDALTKENWKSPDDAEEEDGDTIYEPEKTEEYLDNNSPLTILFLPYEKKKLLEQLQE